VTLGAKGRDTSAAAALAATGVLTGGADTDFVPAAFFADLLFDALFAREPLPAAFFLAPRFAAALRFALFFLPAFRADFLRPDFLRAAGFRAARLRLLFLRAAMCSLPRDADPAPCSAILGSPRNDGQAASLLIMRVTVKLFGGIREAVGEKELSVELPDRASARDLRCRLADRYPVFDSFGDRLAVSVQLEVVPLDTALRDGDEVAFLPPVSGGAGECWISDQPLSEADAAARVKGPGMGGIVTFVGAVRDHARGRAVQHLEYEVYPAMAVREMEKIVSEAVRRWPGTRVAIGHRSGHLEVGEIAVVVAAAAPHRAAAFDACRFAIDTLKETVPIWKKEVAADGEYWVDDRP